MNHRDDARIQSVQAQLDAVNKRLAALEAAHAACDARIKELSDQNTSLVQLTVASQLLVGSHDREDVLSAIEEVVVNMVGSEELAIFDLDSDGESLMVARLRGIEPRSPRLALASGALRRAMKSGHTIVPKDRLDGSGLTVAVPLKIESQVTGVVAIFRLLEQKPALDATDHELFELLSRQAAMALYSTAFRSLRPTVRPPRKSA